MNEKGNRYAISALRDKRATIASEIKALEKSVRHKREQLVHVDAFLALLDPSGDPESIPLKRMVSNINLFRSGELSRLVMTAFREADGEALPTKGIVEAVMRATASEKRPVRPSQAACGARWPISRNEAIL